MTYVSWYGAMAFANYYGYYLPTTWQWRAVADYDGTYAYGCGPTINPGIANYRDSEHPHGTTAVGSFGQYGYGMSDMAGNVKEWTVGSGVGGPHVSRGGGWHSSGKSCTISGVSFFFPGESQLDCDWGFRVCR